MWPFARSASAIGLAREHRLGPQQLAMMPLQLVVPRPELAELDLALGVARLDLGEARAQQGRVLGQPVRGGGHSRSLAPEIPRAWELGSARAAGAEWALAWSGVHGVPRSAAGRLFALHAV